jgi:hypothetical protein
MLVGIFEEIADRPMKWSEDYSGSLGSEFCEFTIVTR